MRVHSGATRVLIVITFAIVLIAPHAFASTSETIASGRVAMSEMWGTPADMIVRRLIVNPGEVLGWHSHTGIGAYTIVKRGTLTVEDGCGGEQSYGPGDAFIEPPNRVHRGKNLGTDVVETIQTFYVPAGVPISSGSTQKCGAPQSITECMNSGWVNFNHPTVFANQGECIQWVNTGR